MWCASAVAPYPASSARMVAPRARACASVSRMRIAAPSPMTNPSRPASNGRLARAGSSFRVERALSEQNPASDKGVIGASLPPAMHASRIPARRSWCASPIACAPEAQAETVAKFAPRAPWIMEICPEAMSAIIIGTKKGETRDGPFSRRTSCCASQVVAPPIPDPTMQPMRLPFPSAVSSPLCSIASLQAAMAYCV